MPIQPLQIITKYSVERFKQFNPEDCANWYQVASDTGKRPVANYPVMGRKHVRVLNQNRLIFGGEPRAIFKSIDFVYVVVGSTVFQVDNNFNIRPLPNSDFNRSTGELFTSFLVFADKVFVMIADNVAKKLFVINEEQVGEVGDPNYRPAGTLTTITDERAPKDPKFVATFGNRFVVSNANSGQWFLSRINLDGDSFDPDTCFTFTGDISLFNYTSGKIQQLATLHNQLYIFNDFGCDIWMNIPSVFDDGTTRTTFPFKLNTSYNFDYGLADPLSLDVDFGRMTWLGRNRNGLVAFMASNGGAPEVISSQAVNTLIQKTANEGNGLSPFLSKKTNGFMYQYENTIFYRVSAGNFLDFGELDVTDSANSLEYNFSSGTWHRCIEVNGERSRIQKHVFFNNKHLVTVSGEGTVYEASGSVYVNELRNTAQANPQATDAYIAQPMRYELVTPIVSQPDYSEFITDYVEIDFVFGEETFIKSDAPFENTVFIVDEESTEENPIYVVTEDGKFVITEDSNTPTLPSKHYNKLFKPHIELYWSDDGGITFNSADVREFSQIGVYRYRMRWYTLGPSRNRCYKLVCVSPAPIVILGGVANMRRSSGGAN
jgi:hypothetical protein